MSQSSLPSMIPLTPVEAEAPAELSPADTLSESALEAISLAQPQLQASGTPGEPVPAFVPPRPSFWATPTGQNVVPFATAVLIHLAIFAFGLLTYKAVQKISTVMKDQIVIPDAVMATGDIAGAIPNPGMGNDRDRTAGQNLDRTINESSGLAKAKNDLNQALVNSSGQGRDMSALLNPSGTPDGKPRVSNTLSEDAGGGTAAPFGHPGGGQGIGPHGKVFGNGGNAVKIVFICDASGSMLAKMDALKLKLNESVQGLLARQAFDVMFFQDADEPDPRWPGYHDLSSDLMMATADNKKKFYNFLQDIVGKGHTHVIPALTAAFHKPTRPDLIYLLTDGAFEDETGDVVAAAINKLNADRKTKVNTILLLGADIPAEELNGARATMQKIAHDNGGTYNQVFVNDLN